MSQYENVPEVIVKKALEYKERYPTFNLHRCLTWVSMQSPQYKGRLCNLPMSVLGFRAKRAAYKIKD